MNELKDLADLASQLLAKATDDVAVVVLDKITRLLRAASSETVGTEWDYTDTMSSPYPQRACFRHNDDLQAARVAIAAAKAEAASLRAAAEYVKPQRQWRREYFTDCSFWVAWISPDRVRLFQYRKPFSYPGWESIDDDTWCLPWREGDTEATLPPLPNPVGKADDPVGKADDTTALELVARLAEFLRTQWTRPCVSKEWKHDLEAILADARRGGGA